MLRESFVSLAAHSLSLSCAFARSGLLLLTARARTPGEAVAATVEEAYLVTNTFTYVEGKISEWVHVFDPARIEAGRAAVVVANTVTVDPVPVVLAGPTTGGSVEQASAYLKQVRDSDLLARAVSLRVSACLCVCVHSRHRRVWIETHGGGERCCKA